jgi:coenzyme F420-reducing hydrogenase beta subunit
MDDKEKMLRAVACYTNDMDIRMQSTSGGIFSELAQEVIRNHGVIFGAKFDKNFNVIHHYTETIEGLREFCGSKYPQSKMGSSFIKVKDFLESGRQVLFSGTACQIEGLLNYLNKEYDNLICVDFICFGVASPKVWNAYLNSYFDRKDIQEIKFKDKKYGWKTWHFLVKKKRGAVRERGNHNIFMNGYLNGIYLRPSCYECCFKGMKNRKSDFTISDCWGIDVIEPEFYDTRGISGLYIHTEKGNKLFNLLGDKISYKDVDVDLLLKYNPYALKKIPRSHNREVFFNIFNGNSMNTKKVFQKFYTMKGFKNGLRRKIIFPIKNTIYHMKNQ